MNRILFSLMGVFLAVSICKGTDQPAENTQLTQTQVHSSQDSGVKAQAVNEEPIFKADPDAEMKLRQIYTFKLKQDIDAIINIKIAEIMKEHCLTNPNQHIISNVAVVFTENIPFKSWVMLIVRINDKEVMIGSRYYHRSEEWANLDRTKADIREALEKMQNSKLPNPGIFLIDPAAFNDEEFNQMMSQTQRNTITSLKSEAKTLCGESYVVFYPYPVPRYLVGSGERMPMSMRDYFLACRKHEFAGLASLVVWGKENTSRDFYYPDGKPKYFFLHTRNSAPVELSLSDLESISSTRISSSEGIYSMKVTTKNGVEVAFGGLSAVNQDFLKSDQNQCKTVVGLSSANGFTISVTYKDGQTSMNISGDAIRKNTSNIQDKLPSSLVRMFRMAIPGIDFLSDSDANVLVEGAVALGEIKDPCAVKALSVLLKDSNAAVRRAAACALGQIGDPQPVIALMAATKDNDWRTREAAVVALGEIKDSRAVEPLLAVLKNDEWNVRKAAIVALGNIKDKQAVELLVLVLKDQNDWRMRKAAAISLGQIKDTMAVEPLLNVVKEPQKSPRMEQDEVKITAALALLDIQGQTWLAKLKDSNPILLSSVAWRLGEVGDKRAIPFLIDGLPAEKYGKMLSKLEWQPQTEREQVYFWISMGQMTELNKNWKQTRRILLEDVQSGSKRLVDNAAITFIRLGQEEIIGNLVTILAMHGSKEMAETYLNCGNKKLEEAASKWAIANGYTMSKAIPGFGTSGASWGPASWGKWR